MRDVAIQLENRPGSLAELGETLEEAGISIEGGGGFIFEGRGMAHFLFENGDTVCRVLTEKGFEVIHDREVLVQRLRQDQAGQLGQIARMMANANVNIEVVYSDHQNNLILVVDDLERGRTVSERWKSERGR